MGRGEEVYPLADLPSIPMVVVTPDVGVSTPQAFKLGITGRAHENRAPEQVNKLTEVEASDRLVVVGCALSAWLTDANGSSYPNTGASAKGGSRVGKLLSGLVRTGIENDFERVVFPEYPELRDIKGELERTGAVYASLSGSGSSLYGLFRSRAEAARGAVRLQRQGVAAVATRTD